MCYLFPAFTETTEIHHLFGLLVPGFKPRESEKFTVFCEWYNSIPFRNFRTNGKRSQTTLEIPVSQNLEKLGGGGP